MLRKTLESVGSAHNVFWMFSFAKVLKVPIIFVVHSMGGLVVKKVGVTHDQAMETNFLGISARTE